VTVGSLPRRKRAVRLGAYSIGVAFAALWIADLVARERAAQPWRPAEVRAVVEPGGRLFTARPTPGYTHLPGRFTVTLSGGLAFQVTQPPGRLRIPHPLEIYDDDSSSQSRPAAELPGYSPGSRNSTCAGGEETASSGTPVGSSTRAGLAPGTWSWISPGPP